MTNRSRPYLVLVALVLGALTGALQAAIKPEAIPELRPPQGQLEEPLLERARWPWLVAGACLIAGAFLLWPRNPRAVITESPAAIARRRLGELQPLEPMALGQVLREYIIATHSVPGPGQTFDQLAAVLEVDHRWTPALREHFRSLADPLEIAKFAPGANQSNLEALRQRALALIDEAEVANRPRVPSR